MRGKFNSIKEYYDKFYKTEDEGKCVFCGCETKFENIAIGYKHFCGKCQGSRNFQNHILHLSALRPDVIERKYIGRTKYYNNLSEDEYANLIAKAQKKRYKTILERYGESYCSDRTKAQWERRTQEEIDAIVKKANQTKAERCVEYSCETYKQYCVVDESHCRNVYCQGYEDLFIKFLLAEGVDFVNGKEVPRIPYTGNISGKTRPDIYLPQYNSIIEVKSDYTFYTGFEKQKAIAKTAFELGYNYAVFVSKGCGKQVRELKQDEYKCCKDFMDMLIRSQGQFLKEIDKVQRLSGDTEYKPIVFGLGNGRVPESDIILNPQWNVI